MCRTQAREHIRCSSLGCPTLTVVRGPSQGSLGTAKGFGQLPLGAGGAGGGEGGGGLGDGGLGGNGGGLGGNGGWGGRGGGGGRAADASTLAPSMRNTQRPGTPKLEVCTRSK